MKQIQQPLLDRLDAMATEPLAIAWLRCYYAHAVVEVLECPASHLYGAAMAHLQLSRQRMAGEMRLRVYNPTLETDGWESAYTIVELISDDLPFLVDSLCIAAHSHGQPAQEVFQAIAHVQRDAAGYLQAVFERGNGIGQREVLVRLELVRQADPELLERLRNGLMSVLADVQAVVKDWQPMREALAQAQVELYTNASPVPPAERTETIAFLKWLAEHHFTFIGACNYDKAMEFCPGSGLGILRQVDPYRITHCFAGLSPQLEPQPKLLLLTKAHAHSTVHRGVELDLVGIRQFDAAGQVIGEHRFLGLYSSRAYNCLPQAIPVVRQVIAEVVHLADLDPTSSSATALQHILDTYPRDELLQIDAETLYRISLGILRLGERHQTKLFIRQDRYGRFLTCLVYVPRERYDTKTRLRIQKILHQAFNAVEITFSVTLTEAALARVLFLVRPHAEIPPYNAKAIETQLVAAALSWQDQLRAALLEHTDEATGFALYQEFADAFPAGYQEDCEAHSAIQDIMQMRDLSTDGELRLVLYDPASVALGQLRLRIFRRNEPLPLHQVMPILENMAVHVEDERPYKVQSASGIVIWIHDFGLSLTAKLDPDTNLHVRFQDAFTAIWQGRMVNDGLNALILLAGLDWRRVVLLRTYVRYLRQTTLTLSQPYMEEALTTHPDITRLLVELFALRFDPARPPQAPARLNHVTASIHTAMDGVQSLDHDRILRSFLAAIWATLRTNYYQQAVTGGPKTRIALKFDSKRLLDLPEPRPLCEIFVYTPQVEGIHLRGGLVARGGLRWSDRREDYRTEVLGLMKAQMVKNTVIVPVGAKGGFVIKQLSTDGNRESAHQEGLACYRQFVAGLLDLTDNITKDGCRPPPDLVRYDGDDPYLVVAADKGTANFSDTANEVAASYGFWLGDAFASGGRTGYDHKQMGITARGAWECIRQHFRALGLNYEQQPFSVIGIGDMSGDVFGNGLLLSSQIQLLAAFDHRHIFLDPNPNLLVSLQERSRLFALPSSSWADYNPSLISTGGGVYSRNLKSIALSLEARVALACDAQTLTPADLVRTILRTPVDLLWNGGIGTFVKASWERHQDVGDRLNDTLRVDATELRCRIIGEGGNLGLTQAARVEYAQLGGRLDTDFIHNLGGVNCSDHEVNIKILLDQVVAEGILTTAKRNLLLASMTAEIAALVLQDSYWQGCAIGLEEARGAWLLPEQARFINHLEQAGHLNRTLENLPSDAELHRRHAAGLGLTRPEIAMLIAYAKHSLYEDLLASDLPEDPSLAPELERYFPTPLREPFQTQIHRHRLRREILCTTLANRLVNRFGSTFVFRLQEEFTVASAAMVRAGTVVWEIFGLCHLWTAVAALPANFPETLRLTMLNRAGRLASMTCRRLLQIHGGKFSTGQLVARYQSQIADLMAYLPDLLGANLESITAPLKGAGTPAALAILVAELEALGIALDLVAVAEQTSMSIRDVATVAFHLQSTLELDWLNQCITALPTPDQWHLGARVGLRDELHAHLRLLCVAILQGGLSESSVTARLEFWHHSQHVAVEHYRLAIEELRTHDNPDVAMLWVTLRTLPQLADGFTVYNIAK